jgi:hypothetical protein
MNLRSLVDRYFIKKPAVRRAVTRWLEGDRGQEAVSTGASKGSIVGLTRPSLI